MSTLKDINGLNVVVGDTVKVLKIPEVDYTAKESEEVFTMLNCEFVIESIEHDCVEVTKWWKGSNNTSHCHSLFLFSNEFKMTNTVRVRKD